MAESSIPATQNLDSEKKKYEISLYKRLLEPTNPYVIYNNTDRLLNIVYRYYTTGGFESLYTKEGLVGIKDKLGYQYEAQSNLLAQYYWATTAILGVGYSINRPQLVSGNQGEAAIAALVLTRSVVNMVLETSLAIANNVRWAEKRFGTVEYHPALHGSSSSANAFDGQQPNALQFPMGELDENWRFVPFSHTASSREIAHPVGSEPSERTVQQSSADLVSDSTGSRDKIKNIRNYHDTVTSAGFALNAALAVGIQLGLIIRAAQKPDAERNGAEIASAVIGLVGATANVFANSFKSLDSFSKTLVSNPGLLLDPDLPEKIARWEKASKNGIFGKLGSYLGGSLNGLAGIASLSPYLFSDRLTSQQKGLVAAEISAQVAGSLGQIAANVWLARTTGRGGAYAKIFDDTGAATRTVRYLRLAGPGMLTASAALLAVTSPLEIYALAKQGEYARDLDELGKKLGAHGYSGDSLLANFYREKNTAQSGIFAATATVELFASVLMVSAIAAGPGAPVAAVAGLALSGFAALARAVESPILERLAQGYASKIQDAGGAAAFFDSNLSAQYKAQLTSLGPGYLDELQAGFKVDSVVGVSTMILTRQAMELAVLTRNTDRLRSAHVYIDRFIGGKVQDSGIQKTTIDAETGKLTLGGAAGTTQALTFLNPLLQPGKEERETVEVRGKASATSLEITLDGKKVTPDNVEGWTIDDGDASSTMDLRNVVTRATNPEKTETVKLPITVNGGGGDDTVIANASQLTFNGGDGFDVVDYNGLKGQVSNHQVERFTTGDGKQLGNAQVDRLVQGMASFSPPGLGSGLSVTDILVGKPEWWGL